MDQVWLAPLVNTLLKDVEHIAVGCISISVMVDTGA
jgi:hypothetical protein